MRLSKALAGGCALLRVSCAPTSRFVRLNPWDFSWPVSLDGQGSRGRIVAVVLESDRCEDLRGIYTTRQREAQHRCNGLLA